MALSCTTGGYGLVCMNLIVLSVPACTMPSTASLVMLKARTRLHYHT